MDDWLCAFTIEGHESTVWCNTFSLSHFHLEIDFDRTGRYMVSCGEDKNWMIWDIQETNYENKGIISGLHSRAIYSCSWSKGVI